MRRRVCLDALVTGVVSAGKALQEGQPAPSAQQRATQHTHQSPGRLVWRWIHAVRLPNDQAAW